MATGSNRDVQLNLSVNVADAQNIRKLQEDVQALANEGGSAAPKFQALSDEIGRLGVQANTLQSLGKLGEDIAQLAVAEGLAAKRAAELETSLADVSAKANEFKLAQEGAKQALMGAQAALSDQRQALAILKNETDDTGRKTDEYRVAVKKLNTEIIESKANVRQLGEAYKEVKGETALLVDGENKLVASNNRAQQAAREAAQALLEQTANLRDASNAAISNGLATKNLAESQATLVNALADSESSLRRLIQAQRDAADESARQQRESDRLAGIQLNSKRELLAAGQRQLAAERQGYAEMEAAQRRAAEVAQQTGAAIDNALRVVGVRGANAIQAEIEEVRRALDLLKSSGTLAGSELATAMGVGARRVKELERNLREANGALTLGDQAAKLFSSSIGQIGAGNIVANAVGYLVNKVSELGRAFVTANVEMESTRRGLTAIYGSSQTAATQIDFLRSTATAAGVSMGGITNSFVKFSAATQGSNLPLKVTNDLFVAVTRASSTLGLSTERTGLVLDALGQIASKGVVSLEELRQQLGDSLPGALSLSAKGLGITEAELIKLVTAGQLAANDFFPALTKGLQSLQGETDTLRTRFANLQNALLLAATSGGDAGWTDVLKGGLATLKVVAASVIIPISALGEILFATGKAAGVFAAAFAITRNPLEAFKASLDSAKISMTEADARLIALENSFFASSSAATASVAAIGNSTSALISNSVAAAQNAVSTAGAGTAAAGTGNAFVQMLVSVQKLTLGVEANILAAEKLQKAKEFEGKSLVQIAQLTGNATTIVDAATKASQANAEAATLVVKAREAEVAVTQMLIDKTVALAGGVSGLSNDQKKLIEELQVKLVVQQASVEKSQQERAELTAQATAAKIASQAYRDNSASVEVYRQSLALAQADLPLYEAAVVSANAQLLSQNRLFAEGKATLDSVRAAQVAVTDALQAQKDALIKAAASENLYRDAIEDRAKSQGLATQGASLALQKTLSLINLDIERNKVMAATARAQGDLSTATYYDIEAKSKQIKVIELKLKIQQLEINADITSLELKRSELSTTDPLLVQKQKEIDLRIEANKIKLIEAGMAKEQIVLIEAEITALRDGTSARAQSTIGIDSNTQSRQSNALAIDSQTSALEKQRSASSGKSSSNGSQDDGREAKLKGQGVTDGTGSFLLQEKRRQGTLSAGDLKVAEASLEAAKFNRKMYDENSLAYSQSGGQSTLTELNAAQTIYDQVRGLVQAANPTTRGSQSGTAFAASSPETTARGSQSVTASAASNPETNTSRTITINMGGTSSDINVASERDGEKLQNLLMQLVQAKRSSR